MGLINAIKLYRLYAKAEAVAKEKAGMKTKVTQYVTLFVSLAGTVGIPAMASHWLASHLDIYAGLVCAAIVLHAIFPSIFAAPSTEAIKNSGLKTLGIVPLLLGAGMLMPAAVHAQSATSGTPTAASVTGFSATSGPVAVHYAGEWSAATYQRESYDFLDWGATKGNHLDLNGIEFEMPTPGVNLYLGGVDFRPDLASLFKKTNLPEGSFGVFIDGNIGNGVPTNGGSHISWMAGGGVTYRLSQALSWQPLTVQYGRFGTTPFTAMSTQLQFLFGK